jgi:hypothetical protein
MYITILSGHVSHENWTALENSFEKVQHQPPVGLLQSSLVQSDDDPTQWEIISLWQSHAIYLVAEEKQQTNLCVRLFCDAGSIPNRRGYKMVRRYVRV